MIVVFDTNAYRTIVAKKNIEQALCDFDAILAAEKKQGYRAGMCTIVALELMKHWLDSTDSKEYRSCVNASKVLYKHCQIDANRFLLLPLTEVEVAKDYYHITNTKAILTQQEIGKRLYSMYKASIGDEANVISNYNNDLQKIKTFIEDGEDGIKQCAHAFLSMFDTKYKEDFRPFVNDNQSRTKCLNYLRSNEFIYVTSAAMLQAVAMKHNIKMDGKFWNTSEGKQMIETYANQYKSAIKFRQLWMENLAGGSYDMNDSTHANCIWDEHILHFINQAIGDENLLLVTRDKAMARAAEETGYKNKVMLVDDYIAHLSCSVKILV